MTVPQHGLVREPVEVSLSQSECPTDPRELLLAAPMSRFQMFAVGVVALLSMMDGFDVLAITFVGPALIAEWGIDKRQLGHILAAGPLGMAIGSLLLAPIADAIGRRRVLFMTLMLMSGGTLWSALAADATSLTLSRIVTGVGIGSMVGIASPLAAEYANARRRDMAVSLVMTSFGLGAICGGLLSSVLLAAFSWRAIFFVASALGLIALVAAWRVLIEPLAFVIARPGTDGLARANEYLRRAGHPPIVALPPPTTVSVPIADIFRGNMRGMTVPLTAMYFVYMMPQYYLQTWVPTLVTDLGISVSRAALVSSALAAGGVSGGLFVAAMSLRIGLKRLELTLMAVGTAAMIGFSLLPANLPLLIGGAALTGFFVQGGVVGFFAIVARTFPTHLRASGTGFVTGIGRLGSIFPPLIAGTLFTIGIGPVGVTALMAAPTLVALLLLIPFRVRPPTLV